ncbi:MAG: MFS transporter [Anaerolineales bacterium]|nr:MFS transporter [Anaerolineales bacterium]
MNQRFPALSRLVAPLDRSLAHLSANTLTTPEIARLRWLWLDSLFANLSGAFFVNFVPLFAQAYGASNAQIGLLPGVASLLALLSLLPGARAAQAAGRRRIHLVVVFGGVIARVVLLIWVAMPFLAVAPTVAVALIIAVNALMAFCNTYSNPAWTTLMADSVPAGIRGRFFSHRGYAVNLPALLVVPLAGWLIEVGAQPGRPLGGYQLVFGLAFLTGALATLSFARVDDPLPAAHTAERRPWRAVAVLLGRAPSFMGLVACTLIWNLGMQVTSPFLNLYLVTDLGGTTAMVGWVAASASLAALLTQRWLGAWIDRRGNVFAQGLLSFLIVSLPFAWLFATAAWQIVIVNAFGGVLWAGYNLASFNLLLELAPEKARAEGIAVFQLTISLCATLVPILGGYLADAWGYRPLLVISAALRFLGALAFVWWVALPARRRLAAASAERAALPPAPGAA